MGKPYLYNNWMQSGLEGCIIPEVTCKVIKEMEKRGHEGKEEEKLREPVIRTA